ncbi:MAG: hypothetical protein K9K67_09450 [Bacteriovoracaceae bacterium]|nr:hypothetical protein [Bacteriovoracaceae bacterium]
MSQEQVSFYVEGKLIVASEGETLFEAINRDSFEIQGYCFHPLFESSSKCLLCNIYDEKRGDVISACRTAPIEGGRYSLYHNDLTLAKKEVDSLYQSSHHFNCTQCDNQSRCRLVNEIGNKGLETSAVPKEDKAHKLSEELRVNLKQCITCMMCTDFEKSVTEQPALYEEAGEIKVKGEFSHNYGVNLLDICPTGCFESKEILKRKTSVIKKDFCRGCDRLCRTEVHFEEGQNGLRAIRASSPLNSTFWVCDEVNKPIVNNLKLPLRSLLTKKDGSWIHGDYLSTKEPRHLIIPKNLPEELWQYLISNLSSIENVQDWSYEFISWKSRANEVGLMRTEKTFSQEKQNSIQRLLTPYDGELKEKSVVLIAPEWLPDLIQWSTLLERFKRARHKAFAGAFINAEIYESANTLIPLQPYWEMSWKGKNYQNEEVFISREAKPIKIFKGEKGDS